MRSIYFALALLLSFPFGAEAKCYSSANLNDACRYPAGDSWCARKGKPPYAYRDACEPLQQTGTPQPTQQPQPYEYQPPSSGYSTPSSDWLPTDSDIRSALQRELDGRMARLDALAAQCKNLESSQNPMAAVMCLMSGGGMVTSQTFNAHVDSVSLDECVRSNEGVAYCRYRANTTMSGAGLMGQMAEFANALGALGGWTYSSFVNDGRAWHFQKTYDSCSWGDGGIHCRWTERR